MSSLVKTKAGLLCWFRYLQRLADFGSAICVGEENCRKWQKSSFRLATL